MGNIPWELFDYSILWPFGENRLPSSPDSSGRIEAPVSGAIGEWPLGASIRLRWRGATRQPAAFSPSPFSFFLFPFSFRFVQIFDQGKLNC